MSVVFRRPSVRQKCIKCEWGIIRVLLSCKKYLKKGRKEQGMTKGTTTRRGRARTWDRNDIDRWIRPPLGTSWNNLEAVLLVHMKRNLRTV